MHPEVFIINRFYNVFVTWFCTSENSDFHNAFWWFLGTSNSHAIWHPFFISKTKVLMFCENATLTSVKPNTFWMFLIRLFRKCLKLLPNRLWFIRVCQRRVAIARLLVFPWEKLVLAPWRNRIDEVLEGCVPFAKFEERGVTKSPNTSGFISKCTIGIFEGANGGFYQGIV